MTTTRFTLADVDPAAHHDCDPDTTEARAMLTAITKMPRPSAVPRTRRHPLLRSRPALALAVTCAAAAVIAIPVVAGNDQHHLGSGAYAVTTAHDGSIKLTIHWSQTTNVAALQKALNAAHARTKVLTATEEHARRIGDPTPSAQACAAINPGTAAQPDNAVTWHAHKPISGIVIRPNLFPENETLLLEVVFIRSTGAIAGVSTTLALAPLPTCAGIS